MNTKETQQVMENNKKQLVTTWIENGRVYELFSHAVTSADIGTDNSELISVFEYLGGRTPPAGIGKSIYDYAKQHNERVESKYIESKSYSGLIMMYTPEFLARWFSIENSKTPEIDETRSVDDDDLPF
jgi:hypothetical protein